ncbi:mannose-1-phosphate guanylyltransferase/mannose-6-phosphate isomerase [Lutibaculum baratangense]|uniref:mannose-1-phosphate guanylyltransferase n=1 Tax=Lutibaculum baratangense AMV1 TaxID=631454 RepID=V4QTH5_9HYPH|nr:mannose-1-phosphate guanylyltransferase/mannose-6-phosphate isomerase [Lutibaculum baratangense]ESR23057.1 Mannose-1-phosphate guanylyltransferase (GDP) [Lutibaculum baratangense AMV1]
MVRQADQTLFNAGFGGASRAASAAAPAPAGIAEDPGLGGGPWSPGEVVPVILSGGCGSRLWPLSRTLFPKQFLSLHGEHPMFAATVNRCRDAIFAPPLVICHEEHRFIVAEQLAEKDIAATDVMLEPTSRGTAFAIAAAAWRLVSDEGDPLMLVLPSDHVIANGDAFATALQAAVPAARDGRLVLFGIEPDHADTGFGYITFGAPVSGCPGACDVDGFTEKPSRSRVDELLAAGHCLWNSGMFLFRAGAVLEELGRIQPDISRAAEHAVGTGRRDGKFLRLDRSHVAECPTISIDHALMEHSRRSVVVPISAGWNDVGTWSGLWALAAKDEGGNAAVGDVILEESRNCYIRSEDPLVAVAGVEDVVVVATDDAVLVADRTKPELVKSVVQRLKRARRGEAEAHSTVFRPWGNYRCIDRGERFQVKRIVVQPGERLSLQMHHHRAEHWVVVTGTATVTCGDRQFLLYENESTYISPGQVHRLENQGKIPLHLIEVQTGSYLDEDDIVRFEDRYGRVASDLEGEVAGGSATVPRAQGVPA